MSYDLYLYTQNKDSLDQEESSKILTEFDPQLEVFKMDFQKIAESQKITEKEAREKYSHIELNDTQETGIQITIFPKEITVTVPYWYHSEKAIEIFKKIWRYLETLQNKSKLIIFDPQLGRNLALANDFETSVNLYSKTTLASQKLVSNQFDQKKKWWEVWKK